MVNLIWIFLIIVGITYSLLTNQKEILNEVILNVSKDTLKIFYTMFASIIFFEGILEVAKEGGFLNFMIKIFRKPLGVLFKNLAPDSEALKYICANIVANILGLGSAATPMGLKAMKALDDVNESDVASNEMITFVLLNTCGMTILPSTILSLRNDYHAINTVNLIPYIILTSFVLTFLGLFLNKLITK